MKTIIADAGPLLHLFWVEASAWALPPQEIEVVETVWQEVAAYAPEALGDGRLRRLPSPSSVPGGLALRRLDRGEEAALAHALAQPATTGLLVLCDDYQARRACRAFSLPVIGSVGLIIEAHRAGRVFEEVAATALQELSGRGRFYVKPTLIAQALASIRADAEGLQ